MDKLRTRKESWEKSSASVPTGKRKKGIEKHGKEDSKVISEISVGAIPASEKFQRHFQ